jgi:hypothetical protein
MTDAQASLGLVAKAGERWPVWQIHWSNNRWESGPNEASVLRECLGGKSSGIKWKIVVENRSRELQGGVPGGGAHSLKVA